MLYMLMISELTCVAAAVVHVGDGLPRVRLGVVALHGLADERPVVPAHREQRVAEDPHARAGPPGGHVAHLKDNWVELGI